jgi:pimeloyl-ACP methyl ester carboxylesterase
MRAVGGRDPVAGSERVACPVLSVAGTRDLIVPLADSEELARLLPGARTVTFQACGHMVMLERPMELAKRLVDFGSICSTHERSDNEVVTQQ